jgi:hypothetical protein
MATPEEEISALKADITKNTARLDSAINEGNEEVMKLFGNLIIAKETRLNTLLQQQQPQGE